MVMKETWESVRAFDALLEGIIIRVALCRDRHTETYTQART